MITSITFKNYRILRDARLELGACNLLLGPNGSGKSTVISALRIIADTAGLPREMHPANPPKIFLSDTDLSFGSAPGTKPEVTASWQKDSLNAAVSLPFQKGGQPFLDPLGTVTYSWLSKIRIFSLNPEKIALPSRWEPNAEIRSDGSNLGVVLTQLQDQHFERFEALNHELSNCLPEFDRILFETSINSERSLMLRTKNGKHAIRASDLSQGILLALCLLSLSYLPEPPTMVCLEEPDRGIHPRLFRYVHDAMIRLSDPAAAGESREPVQVLATTHSPYLLDLFRDHPEDIVLAEKGDDGATFHKLTSMSHFEEIMNGSSLGDAWYTGILGGVPVKS